MASAGIDVSECRLPAVRGHEHGDRTVNRSGDTRRCLICGGSTLRPVFIEQGIEILRCRTCGHVSSSYEGDPHYDGFWGETVADADHVYWNRARARMHQDFFDRFVAGRSGRLLDMGCGLGFFLKRLSGYQGWEACGCEISAAAVRYARETLGLENVMCARLEEAPWPRASFNLITLWDVIDHVARPDALLKHCHDLLATDGRCFIRTPNISMHLPRARLKALLWGERRDTTYLQPRDHLHHYSSVAIQTLLERNGFSRVQVLHLHAIDSPSSKHRTISRAARSLWFHASRGVDRLSRGHINIDNLYVIAQV